MYVHVLHRGGADSIPAERVASQLEAFNRDFPWLNADTVKTRPEFQPVAADIQIGVCTGFVFPVGGSAGDWQNFKEDATWVMS